MKLAQDIILRPVITEETMTGIAEKKYAFRVAKTATKPEIREAVEKLFDVKVTSEVRREDTAITKVILLLGRKQSLHLPRIQRQLSSSII